jgi:hypothetical protein
LLQETSYIMLSVESLASPACSGKIIRVREEASRFFLEIDETWEALWEGEARATPPAEYSDDFNGFSYTFKELVLFLKREFPGVKFHLNGSSVIKFLGKKSIIVQDRDILGLNASAEKDLVDTLCAFYQEREKCPDIQRIKSAHFRNKRKDEKGAWTKLLTGSLAYEILFDFGKNLAHSWSTVDNLMLSLEEEKPEIISIRDGEESHQIARGLDHIDRRVYEVFDPLHTDDLSSRKSKRTVQAWKALNIHSRDVGCYLQNRYHPSPTEWKKYEFERDIPNYFLGHYTCPYSKFYHLLDCFTDIMTIEDPKIRSNFLLSLQRVFTILRGSCSESSPEGICLKLISGDSSQLERSLSLLKGLHFLAYFSGRSGYEAYDEIKDQDIILEDRNILVIAGVEAERAIAIEPPKEMIEALLRDLKDLEQQEDIEDFRSDVLQIINNLLGTDLQDPREIYSLVLNKVFSSAQAKANEEEGSLKARYEPLFAYLFARKQMLFLQIDWKNYCSSVLAIRRQSIPDQLASLLASYLRNPDSRLKEEEYKQMFVEIQRVERTPVTQGLILLACDCLSQGSPSVALYQFYTRVKKEHLYPDACNKLDLLAFTYFSEHSPADAKPYRDSYLLATEAFSLKLEEVFTHLLRSGHLEDLPLGTRRQLMMRTRGPLAAAMRKELESSNTALQDRRRTILAAFSVGAFEEAQKSLSFPEMSEVSYQHCLDCLLINIPNDQTIIPQDLCYKLWLKVSREMDTESAFLCLDRIRHMEGMPDSSFFKHYVRLLLAMVQEKKFSHLNCLIEGIQVLSKEESVSVEDYLEALPALLHENPKLSDVLSKSLNLSILNYGAGNLSLHDMCSAYQRLKVRDQEYFDLMPIEALLRAEWAETIQAENPKNSSCLGFFLAILHAKNSKGIALISSCLEDSFEQSSEKGLAQVETASLELLEHLMNVGRDFPLMLKIACGLFKHTHYQGGDLLEKLNDCPLEQETCKPLLRLLGLIRDREANVTCVVDMYVKILESSLVEVPDLHTELLDATRLLLRHPERLQVIKPSKYILALSLELLQSTGPAMSSEERELGLQFLKRLALHYTDSEALEYLESQYPGDRNFAYEKAHGLLSSRDCSEAIFHRSLRAVASLDEDARDRFPTASLLNTVKEVCLRTKDGELLAEEKMQILEYLQGDISHEQVNDLLLCLNTLLEGSCSKRAIEVLQAVIANFPSIPQSKALTAAIGQVVRKDAPAAKSLPIPLLCDFLSSGDRTTRYMTVRLLLNHHETLQSEDGLILLRAVIPYFKKKKGAEANPLQVELVADAIRCFEVACKPYPEEAFEGLCILEDLENTEAARFENLSKMLLSSYTLAGFDKVSHLAEFPRFVERVMERKWIETPETYAKISEQVVALSSSKLASSLLDKIEIYCKDRKHTQGIWKVRVRLWGATTADTEPCAKMKSHAVSSLRRRVKEKASIPFVESDQEALRTFLNLCVKRQHKTLRDPEVLDLIGAVVLNTKVFSADPEIATLFISLIADNVETAQLLNPDLHRFFRGLSNLELTRGLEVRLLCGLRKIAYICLMDNTAKMRGVLDCVTAASKTKDNELILAKFLGKAASQNDQEHFDLFAILLQTLEENPSLNEEYKEVLYFIFFNHMQAYYLRCVQKGMEISIELADIQAIANKSLEFIGSRWGDVSDPQRYESALYHLNQANIVGILDYPKTMNVLLRVLKKNEKGLPILYTKTLVNSFLVRAVESEDAEEKALSRQCACAVLEHPSYLIHNHTDLELLENTIHTLKHNGSEEDAEAALTVLRNFKDSLNKNCVEACKRTEVHEPKSHEGEKTLPMSLLRAIRKPDSLVRELYLHKFSVKQVHSTLSFEQIVEGFFHQIQAVVSAQMKQRPTIVLEFLIEAYQSKLNYLIPYPKRLELFRQFHAEIQPFAHDNLELYSSFIKEEMPLLSSLDPAFGTEIVLGFGKECQREVSIEKIKTLLKFLHSKGVQELCERSPALFQEMFSNGINTLCDIISKQTLSRVNEALILSLSSEFCALIDFSYLQAVLPGEEVDGFIRLISIFGDIYKSVDDEASLFQIYQYVNEAFKSLVSIKPIPEKCFPCIDQFFSNVLVGKREFPCRKELTFWARSLHEEGFRNFAGRDALKRHFLPFKKSSKK